LEINNFLYVFEIKPKHWNRVTQEQHFEEENGT